MEDSCSIIFTRELMGRLRKVVAGITRFVVGQRLPAAARDDNAQLAVRLNEMASQLAASLAREKVLVEQNVRLEEQARFARELQESVRQQIFARKLKEKQLVEQNARLEERTRLSRDLHDTVKQQVFALAVQIELARSLLEQDHAAALEHLGFADELSYQIQQELTALIDALHPADLQAKGLTAALRDYATSWSRQNRIVADLSLPETCLLPLSIEEVLWRVTQEALSNTARHSQARTMQLHLARTEQHVSLSIADDGVGFEVTAPRHGGFGLRSLRERVEQVGGTLLIQSGEGVGTRIVVRCTLSERQADGASSEDEATT